MNLAMEKQKEAQIAAKTEVENAARHAMMMGDSTEYAERFAAVLTDMLGGRHISQTEPSDRDMYNTSLTEDDLDDIEDY